MTVDLDEQILKFIDSLLHPLMLHEILPLKTKSSIELISRIIKESNKTVPEAVLVLLAVVRYLRKDNNAGSSQDFIKANSHLIFKMAIEKRIQANFPERALPLLEIFEKKIKSSSISVIELGASYGLIGRCLINSEKVMKKKELYFSPEQQIPENLQSIDYYLGIELDPPDEKWLLACAWDEIQRKRLKDFIHDITADKRIKLQKTNAFGFSKLKSVKNLAAKPSCIVILTSFLLYQYSNKKQKLLKDEILRFTKKINGYWINQTIDVSSLQSFIEFDREKIIELPTNLCKQWEWVK